jgi:hypothetical protein
MPDDVIFVEALPVGGTRDNPGSCGKITENNVVQRECDFEVALVA